MTTDNQNTGDNTQPASRGMDRQRAFEQNVSRFLPKHASDPKFSQEHERQKSDSESKDGANTRLTQEVFKILGIPTYNPREKDHYRGISRSGQGSYFPSEGQ
jgi:hypothetical protein